MRLPRLMLSRVRLTFSQIEYGPSLARIPQSPAHPPAPHLGDHPTRRRHGHRSIASRRALACSSPTVQVTVAHAASTLARHSASAPTRDPRTTSPTPRPRRASAPHVTRHVHRVRPLATQLWLARRQIVGWLPVERARRPALVAVAPARPAGEIVLGRVSEQAMRQRVWGLALPAIGEQVLALGVGVSDTFLSGHLAAQAIARLGYDRATAVAAVGAASTAVWVILTIFFAVNIGVTALVARATGARDSRLAARAAGQGILLGAIAGLAMIALAVPLAGLMIHLLGVTGEIAILATRYIQIMSLALPATGMASAATAAMRGASDAKRPLLVMLIVNGINVLASWTLMNGIPALGIAPFGVIGSAIGAAIGWVLGCLLALYFLTRRHPKAPRLSWPALRPDREVMARVLRIGLPSGAELGIFQLGVLTFYRVVIALGPAAYAANITINTVESLGSLPGFGFAVAATALVGQSLGAGDPDLAVRAAWASLRPCLAVMGFVGVLALILPHLLLGLFVADPAVLSAGDVAMRLSVLILPASAVAFVFNGALRGSGDTKFPVLVRAAGTWGLRVPLATVLIPLWALPGARLAMVADFCAEAALTYWRFRSGRWRSKRV